MKRGPLQIITFGINTKNLVLIISMAAIGLLLPLASTSHSFAQSPGTNDTATKDTISFKMQLKSRTDALDSKYYLLAKSLNGFTNSSDICPSNQGCNLSLTNAILSLEPTGSDEYAFSGRMKITMPIDDQSSRSKFYDILSDLKLFKEKVNGSKTIRFLTGSLNLDPSNTDYNITKALLFFDNKGSPVLSIEGEKIPSGTSTDKTGVKILTDSQKAVNKITSDMNKAIEKIKKATHK